MPRGLLIALLLALLAPLACRYSPTPAEDGGPVRVPPATPPGTVSPAEARAAVTRGAPGPRRPHGQLPAADAGLEERRMRSAPHFGGPADDRVLACTRNATDKATLMQCLNALRGEMPLPKDLDAGAKAHLFGATRPPIYNPAWNVPAWHWNESSGNNANTCVDSAHPCHDPNEIIARWETREPVLAQATTLNNDADSTTWLDYRPIIVTGGSSQQLCAMTTTASGTMGTVTAKLTSRTPVPALQVDLTTNSSGAQGLMIVNSTHPGVGWVDQNITGTVWSIVQPQQSNVPTFATFETEVNTWTTGDSYTLQRPSKLALAAYEPTVARGVGGGSLEGYFAFLGHCWIPDPTGTNGSTYTNLSHLVRATENRIDSYLIYPDAGDGFDGTLQNNFIAGTGILSDVAIQGGAVNAINTTGFQTSWSGIADFDVSFHSGLAVTTGRAFDNLFGAVECDALGGGAVGVVGVVATADLNVTGDVNPAGLYGTCAVNNAGHVAYTSPGTASFLGGTTTKFVNSASIFGTGVAFGNATDPTLNPQPTYGPRAMTPTSLSAAIGGVSGTGFGDLATSDNGATYTGRVQSSAAPGPLCPTSGQALVSNGTIMQCTALSTTCPVPVTCGGTNDTTLTAHAVLVGEGTSSVATVGPCSTTTVVHGAGASADPTCSSVNLAADVGSSILPVANGGFGADTSSCVVHTDALALATGSTWNGCLPAGGVGSFLEVVSSGSLGYQKFGSFFNQNSGVSIPNTSTVTNIIGTSVTAPATGANANISIGFYVQNLTTGVAGCATQNEDMMYGVGVDINTAFTDAHTVTFPAAIPSTWQSTVAPTEIYQANLTAGAHTIYALSSSANCNLTAGANTTVVLTP